MNALDFAPRTFASAAAHSIYAGVNAADTSGGLDEAAREVWRAFGAGEICDNDAEFLQDCIDRRRPLARAATTGATGRARQIAKLAGPVGSRFPTRPRRTLTCDQRRASRERRRTLGGSAPMPPGLRAQYTEGERAVLAIIAGEVKHHGLCDLPIDKIAALAGVCRSTAQNALRAARRLGHVSITARPRPGQKNLTNIVRIVSAEWAAWIKRGPTAHRPGGSGFKTAKMLSPTKSTFEEKASEMVQRAGYGPPARCGGR